MPCPSCCRWFVFLLVCLFFHPFVDCFFCSSFCSSVHLSAFSVFHPIICLFSCLFGHVLSALSVDGGKATYGWCICYRVHVWPIQCIFNARSNNPISVWFVVTLDMKYISNLELYPVIMSCYFRLLYFILNILCPFPAGLSHWTWLCTYQGWKKYNNISRF